jgi:hypothetical protein
MVGEDMSIDVSLVVPDMDDCVVLGVSSARQKGFASASSVSQIPD